jgi:colicin import membrane protein
MSQAVRENWKYFSGAVLIHGALAALLFVSVSNFSRQTPPAQLAIRATLVDKSMLKQLARPQEQQEPQVDKQKEAEAEKQKQEEAERQRQQEQQAQREREQQQEKEREQQQAVERQREIDKQKQAEAQLQEQAKQRQAAMEQQRQKALEEQKRLADIQQKQREAEQRKKAEADARAQAAREAELKAQLAAEEGVTEAVNAGLQNQYVALIQQKVMRNWIRPASAKPGLLCEVRVRQTSNGTVLSATVGQCNGDAAVRQSIETAVLSSSPLPAPPDPRVFQSNLVFNFKPVE